jgi:hypothetical protein
MHPFTRNISLPHTLSPTPTMMQNTAFNFLGTRLWQGPHSTSICCTVFLQFSVAQLMVQILLTAQLGSRRLECRHHPSFLFHLVSDAPNHALVTSLAWWQEFNKTKILCDLGSSNLIKSLSKYWDIASRETGYCGRSILGTRHFKKRTH